MELIIFVNEYRQILIINLHSLLLLQGPQFTLKMQTNHSNWHNKMHAYKYIFDSNNKIRSRENILSKMAKRIRIWSRVRSALFLLFHKPESVEFFNSSKTRVWRGWEFMIWCFIKLLFWKRSAFLINLWLDLKECKSKMLNEKIFAVIFVRKQNLRKNIRYRNLYK